MASDFFNANRQRLIWTLATRQQLERWEPFVARAVRLDFSPGRKLEGVDIWRAATEHHFALIAARHLIRALDLWPVDGVTVDPVLRSELIEGRDLHEHWYENVPIFKVTPRVAEPKYQSAQDFAARNPGRSPYWWLGWKNGAGAMLLPNVSAPAVHELLDRVEAYVLAEDPSFAEFVPARAAPPWIITDDGEWWPKPDE